MKAAASSLIESVLAPTSKAFLLNDAQKGYLERNIKKCIINLLRRIGPTMDSPTELSEMIESSHSGVLSILGKDLDQAVAIDAALYLNDYLQNSDNYREIAILSRSYAALLLRNVDPLCRQFQSDVLKRSVLILDTDALLTLYVSELPQHNIICDSVKLLVSKGVEVHIPIDILGECIGHVSRANKTYNRFAGTLLRRPSEDVMNTVWHAVVQGYYYYKINGGEDEFYHYWESYYNKDEPTRYFQHRLGELIKYKIVPAHVTPEDSDDFVVLAEKTFKFIERRKKKAEYREQAWQIKRAETDVKAAMYASTQNDNEPIHRSLGYVVSGDYVFQFIQKQDEWHARPTVWTHVDSLPRLAEMVCGKLFHDDELIQTLFHPIHAAAASSLSDELDTLVRVGVDLKNKPLARLSWDLKQGLRAKIEDYKYTISKDDADLQRSIRVGEQLAQASTMFDYHIDPEITTVYQEYNRMKAELEVLREDNEVKTQLAKRLIEGASGLTKKGRRRVNNILGDFSGMVNLEEESEYDGGNDL